MTSSWFFSYWSPSTLQTQHMPMQTCSHRFMSVQSLGHYLMVWTHLSHYWSLCVKFKHKHEFLFVVVRLNKHFDKQPVKRWNGETDCNWNVLALTWRQPKVCLTQIYHAYMCLWFFRAVDFRIDFIDICILSMKLYTNWYTIRPGDNSFLWRKCILKIKIKNGYICRLLRYW